MNYVKNLSEKLELVFNQQTKKHNQKTPVPPRDVLGPGDGIANNFYYILNSF